MSSFGGSAFRQIRDLEIQILLLKTLCMPLGGEYFGLLQALALSRSLLIYL